MTLVVGGPGYLTVLQFHIWIHCTFVTTGQIMAEIVWDLSMTLEKLLCNI